MAQARIENGAAQEFQLETRHLVLLIALVIVLCVASFMFGRWVERQSLGPTLSSAASTGRSGDATVEEGADVAKELTFFDTLGGDRQVPLEPQGERRRPAATAPPRSAQHSSPSVGGLTTPSADSSRRSVNEGVMIQVFASKERAAADAVRRRLRAKGYTALMVSDRGAYKVRVGPYADREEAERVAAILREQEDLTTWIP